MFIIKYTEKGKDWNIKNIISCSSVSVDATFPFLNVKLAKRMISLAHITLLSS